MGGNEFTGAVQGSLDYFEGVPVVSFGVGLLVLLLVGPVCLLLAVSKGADWGWSSGTTLGLFAAAVAVSAVRGGRGTPDLRLLADQLLRHAVIGDDEKAGVFAGAGDGARLPRRAGRPVTTGASQPSRRMPSAPVASSRCAASMFDVSLKPPMKA